MDWLKSFFGFFSGLFGLGQKIAEEVHDSNQRKAGAAESSDATNKKTLDTLQDVSKPITDSERDSVWNKYTSGKS